MASRFTDNKPNYVVVHPLNDVVETKHDPAGMGPMRLSGGTRLALMALRGYLVVMVLLVLYHVLVLAGVIG